MKEHVHGSVTTAIGSLTTMRPFSLPAVLPAVAVLLPAWVALVAPGCSTTFGGKNAAPPTKVWNAEDGWVQMTEAESSPSAAALRVEARKAFDAGAYEDSLEGIRSMQSGYPESAEAKEAGTYFLLAECHLNLGDYETAYENYEEALERGARGDLLSRTLDRIYHIGLFYLQGRAKRSFAGIGYTSPSFGVDILIGDKGLFHRFPNLKYADDALLEIGRHYFDKKQYPEAERVYERLVKNYGRGEWAELGEYQLAVTVFRQVRGVDYDQAPLKKAKRLFNTYRNHFPRGVHIEQVREFLGEISEMEARHDLKVAKYYLRESRPDAAIYYLKEVLLNTPNTDAAREAREMYRQMANYRGLEYAEDGPEASGGGSS